MRIRTVPRAWLDDPGSIPTGRPGPRGWSSASAARNETIVRTVLEAAVLFEVRDRGTRGSCAQRVAVYRLSRGRITEIRVHQEPSGALNA